MPRKPGRPPLVNDNLTDEDLAALIVTRPPIIGNQAWGVLAVRESEGKNLERIWAYIACNSGRKAVRDNAVLRIANREGYTREVLRSAAKHASASLRRELMPQLLP